MDRSTYRQLFFPSLPSWTTQTLPRRNQSSPALLESHCADDRSSDYDCWLESQEDSFNARRADFNDNLESYKLKLQEKASLVNQLSLLPSKLEELEPELDQIKQSLTLTYLSKSVSTCFVSDGFCTPTEGSPVSDWHSVRSEIDTKEPSSSCPVESNHTSRNRQKKASKRKNKLQATCSHHKNDLNTLCKAIPTKIDSLIDRFSQVLSPAMLIKKVEDFSAYWQESMKLLKECSEDLHSIRNQSSIDVNGLEQLLFALPLHTRFRREEELRKSFQKETHKAKRQRIRENLAENSWEKKVEAIEREKCAQSLYFLGIAYLYGKYSKDKNESLGLDYLRQSSQQGNVSASSVLWQLHTSFPSQKEELLAVLRYHEVCAERGDPVSQTCLAELYRRKVYKNKQKAHQYLEQAARSGFFVAKFYLGREYLEQSQKPQSWTSYLLARSENKSELFIKGKELMIAAANQGSIGALEYLNGLQKDFRQTPDMSLEVQIENSKALQNELLVLHEKKEAI